MTSTRRGFHSGFFTLVLFTLPAPALANPDLKLSAVVYVDRWCCIHPGEVCPTMINPLPPTPHSEERVVLEVENTGSTDIPGPITATLSGFAHGLFISSATATFPAPIAAGTRATSNEWFTFILEGDATCPDTLQFTLQVIDGNSDVSDLPVSMPVVDCPGCTHQEPCDPVAIDAVVLWLAASAPGAPINLAWAPFSPQGSYRLLEDDWVSAESPTFVYAAECQDVLEPGCTIADPALGPGAVRLFAVHGSCR